MKKKIKLSILSLSYSFFFKVQFHAISLIMLNFVEITRQFFFLSHWFSFKSESKNEQSMCNKGVYYEECTFEFLFTTFNVVNFWQFFSFFSFFFFVMLDEIRIKAIVGNSFFNENIFEKKMIEILKYSCPSLPFLLVPPPFPLTAYNFLTSINFFPHSMYAESIDRYL